ncbi:hypothetical protein NUW58_g9036 [Xylaria curta]|uniref:Uncharacterized protein n=1 Tax=Xylaria curta TaxID=42375 RepID=A0ACC1N1V9_9PEZI|nr:hypothetical protein NUW58_g9036 [Xylaria curta]
MEQIKALNALEPYLALTKSATAPRAAADLVTQATSNPNTYVFSELLQTPQIQALSQSPDHASYLKLLEIFSYGTYTNYTATTNLPSLNDAQALKLRQLSLLTLAKGPHNLSYAALQQNLGLRNARAVEDLVISAVYAGLVDAQLDPHNSRIVEIKSAATKRHNEKKAWTEQMMKLIDEEKNAELSAHTRGQGALLKQALYRMQGQRFGKRGSGSLDANVDDDEAMDVDEEEPDDGEGGSGNGSIALGGPGKKRANRRKL